MRYEVLVIGGGPGGYTAAIKAAQRGKRVCLIEKGPLGGTCLNVGCIPTKALLKSVSMLEEIRWGAQFGLTGVDTEKAKLDLVKVQERKNAVVKQLVGGVGALLRKNKVTVVKGAAAFVDDHTVAVGDQRLEADAVIIAAGSKAKYLPVEADEAMPVYTSTEILNLTNFPREMAVIGGGVIGTELAAYLAGVGVRVKIIEFLDRLLPMVDREITDMVTKWFEGSGMEVHTSAKVERITKEGVLFTKDGKENAVSCQAVLMAVGRAPDLSGLNLEAAGVRTERGCIVTGEDLQTSAPNIYAVGDVNGRSMLAHTAFAEAESAVENICGGCAKVDYGKIPSGIYLTPEIASVGMTEEQAVETYGASGLRIGRFPMLANGKSKIEGQEKGLLKIISETRYEEIVGAHLCCTHATDMIAELCLAMKLECTADEVASVIHPHPTISEAVQEACLDVDGRAVHI